MRPFNEQLGLIYGSDTTPKASCTQTDIGLDRQAMDTRKLVTSAVVAQMHGLILCSSPAMLEDRHDTLKRRRKAIYR